MKVMQSRENVNYITKLEWIPYIWHHGIISRRLVTSMRVRHFPVNNWLDLRGITSVALWSCYLVRIRKGKPQ